jgi:hypothetical protein
MNALSHLGQEEWRTMSAETAKGAAKSLNKTITEIMEHLGDEGSRPPKDLRRFLRKKIGDLSELWFKRGFNRGHIESHKKFKAADRVPRTLRYTCTRDLSPGQQREVKLKSTIKSKKSRK